MIELTKALPEDVEELTEIQIKTFIDDNKNKPEGASPDGPPGYNSIKWNEHWIQHTPYYKIIYNGQLVGGLILFCMDESHMEVGRIWVDPAFQSLGIGQAAMQKMFNLHQEVHKWTLGTPVWAVRNQHFYEKIGFRKINVTEVDPDLGWAGVEYEKLCQPG